MSLTDAIWQALQRPSPAVTRDKIEALVEEWLAPPTATEEVSLSKAVANIRATGFCLMRKKDLLQHAKQ